MAPAFISTLVDLIGQLTFGIAILAVAPAIAARLPAASAPLRQGGVGAMFGLQAIVSLLIPSVLPGGVAISTASASVALGGLFGGWIGGIVSFALYSVARLAADAQGLSAIPRAAACTIAGMALAGWAHRKRREITPTDLVVLSIVVVLIALVSIAFAPAPRQQVLIDSAVIPLSIALLSGVLLLGGQYLGQRRNQELTLRLAASEARMRDVLNNLPGTVYQMRLNTDGTLSYIFASDRISMSHGISSAQMVANAGLVDSTFLPEEEEARWKFLRESAAAMKPGSREFRMRRRDGSIRWLRTHSTPKRDAQGQVVWTGFTIDITDERQKDEELRRSTETLAANERQLRGIVASVPGVVYQICQAPDGNVTYKFISEGMRTVFGVEPEAVLKDPRAVWSTYLPEDEHDRLQALKESAESLTKRERVFRVRRADGSMRWLHSYSTPHRGLDGGTYWDGVTLDITDQKDMEETLRRSLAEKAASEERMRAIIGSVPGLVYQVRYRPDGSSTYTFLSEGIRDLLGYSAAEAFADQSLIHSARLLEDEPDRIRTVDESKASMSLRIREFRGRHRDGSLRWYHTRSMPHLGNSGEVVWDGITMDITDRKRLEEEVRRSEHMLALGGLVDGVAHNFNNLLQIVSGAAELLLDTLKDHPDRAVADQILNATHRGSRLVNELRRFSLRQPTSMQQVDVNSLLADMRDLASHFVGASVTVELHTDSDLWPVAVNPTRLQSTILSLVLNARDAMPDGGTVRLETQNVELSETEARAIERTPGAYVRVRVTDTGVGMSPEVLKRSTEPFFTTKPANQVGMGLSTVLAFVSQLGGRLSLKSEQGAGTEVTLLLPAQGAGSGEVTPPAGKERARNPANP